MHAKHAICGEMCSGNFHHFHMAGAPVICYTKSTGSTMLYTTYDKWITWQSTITVKLINPYMTWRKPLRAVIKQLSFRIYLTNKQQKPFVCSWLFCLLSVILLLFFTLFRFFAGLVFVVHLGQAKTLPRGFRGVIWHSPNAEIMITKFNSGITEELVKSMWHV